MSFHLCLVMCAGKWKRPEWFSYVTFTFVFFLAACHCVFSPCAVRDTWCVNVVIFYHANVDFVYFFIFCLLFSHSSFILTSWKSRSQEGCLFCHSTYIRWNIISVERDMARNQIEKCLPTSMTQIQLIPMDSCRCRTQISVHLESVMNKFCVLDIYCIWKQVNTHSARSFECLVLVVFAAVIRKMFDPIIYTKCIDFAARKNRDQRRKDPEKTPYINHPIGW